MRRAGIYILAISHFLSKMKNREVFEGGLHEKRKGKRGEKKKKEKRKRKKKKGKKVKRGWRETKNG